MPAEVYSLERDHAWGFRFTNSPPAFGLATVQVRSDGSEDGVLVAGTDRSGSIAVGGTRQAVAAANTARRGLTFQNTSDTEMRVTESGTNATATSPTAMMPQSSKPASPTRRRP